MCDDEVTTHSRVDGGRTSWGTGWYSGVTAIFLSAIGLGSVLCLHFPELLTIPQLRQHYPVALVRSVLHFVLVAGFVSGLISLVLRPQKLLGGAAVAITLIAALLGGSRVELEGSTSESGPFLGLDWFLLNLIFWSAVFIPLERMFAQRAAQPVFRRGWRTDLTYFFVSALGLQLMTMLTFKPATVFFSWTVSMSFRSWVSSQPWWLQILAILIITDLVQYWIHRLFHQVPFLWRFHEIHHSVEVMDWLAGSRLHLVDVAVTRGLTYVPLFVLGFQDVPMAIYVAVVTVQATFIHANVRFQFGPLKYCLATPQFHHWHHAAELAARDKNFAVHLPIWDMIFGTFHLPKGLWPSSYGLQGSRVPPGYIRQLLHPFTARSQVQEEESEKQSTSDAPATKRTNE